MLISETTSPAVMLSPNARNLVTLDLGGAVTVTVNEHEAVRWSASVAVHVTLDAPIANGLVAGGVHETVTGGAPPVAVAVG